MLKLISYVINVHTDDISYCTQSSITSYTPLISITGKDIQVFQTRVKGITASVSW